MKLRAHLFAAAAAAAFLGTAAAPAAAQSDILLRLRSGSPLGDRFRVDSASGFVAKGFIGIGIIPFTGAGDRTEWHPFKAGFRTGGVDGTQWDDSNFGFYTFASGFNTIAQGNYSIAAGYGSWALQSYGVGLGYNARSDGVGAVALGYQSTANGNYSVAIGQRASANNFSGAIVISDQSSTDSVLASANNQFSLRAAGGVRLFTNATKTTGVTLNAGGSSWNVVSDRNRKSGFLAVDGEDLLARLRLVPVTTWRYRDEADRSTFHIGPMAQDWHRAFGFTTDDRTINMSDLDGVNLAGVQALERRTAAQAEQVKALQAENAALRADVAALREQNARFEERLRRLEEAAARH
ncbi:MAG TPA: tail fiber domain-containing protein [Longimicrobiaceae bacterium]